VGLDNLTEIEKRAKQIRVSVRNRPAEIVVFGARDPRGPDNNILIWVDKTDDTLHILVPKAVRCYTFSHMVDYGAYVEFVQE
jgi:hypothetical protein